MCYDISAQLKTQLSRAKRMGDEIAQKEITAIIEENHLKDIYRASGFEHPHCIVYDKSSTFVARWGLIPHWIQDEKAARKIENSTLNARIESIQEKPSFQEAAQHSRAILYIDGFFEHHFRNNEAYPFYVQKSGQEPMIVACLYDTSTKFSESVSTFSIVTTSANSFMTDIHNKPEHGASRMPLILNTDQAELWLDTERDIDELSDQLEIDKNLGLKAYSVEKIRGKNSLGNTAKAIEPKQYQAFQTLF